MQSLAKITPRVLINPKGIDVPIRQLQLQLASDLSWLSKSFAKAITRQEGNSDDLKTLPYVYDQQRQYISMLPDDSVNSYSFFYVEPGSRSIDNESGVYQQATLNAVFFCNLELIDDRNDYLFEEELIEDVLDSLKKNDHIIDFDTITIADRFPEAFELFDIEDDFKWFSKNIAAFRINFNIRYQKDCFQTDLGVLIDEFGGYLIDSEGNKLVDNGGI